jgi:tetratricopeptide (TPR) repeat protein
LVPAGGAVLLGGTGLLRGPLWAVAGAGLGAGAVYCGFFIVLQRTKPNAERLLREGRPQEAYRQLAYELRSSRRAAARFPSSREAVGYYLGLTSQALQAMGDPTRALEAIAEAVEIFSALAAESPGKYAYRLASARLQEATLLGQLSRHGEALAAAEPAVQLFRGLAIDDRGEYLPLLAEALTRQADEPGHLDRISEARAAEAEAEMIRTDMLPSAAQT